MSHLCTNLLILLQTLWNHIIQMLEKPDFIKRGIKSEERFHETLEDGSAILNELIKKLKRQQMKLMGKMHLNCMIRTRVPN